MKWYKIFTDHKLKSLIKLYQIFMTSIELDGKDAQSKYTPLSQERIRF